MIPYFEKFPTIGYDINGSGEKQIAIDILERIKIRDVLKQNWLIFYKYAVKDGETPEMLASKLYGDPRYHWIILLANNIVDPYYDWPMSNDNLIATIRKKYGTPQMDGLIYAYQNIYHYIDSYGNVIDLETYTSLPANQRTAVTVYDWEVSQNEAKREITLLDPSYVEQIDTEADKILAQILV
jgi:hypothetical protein